MIRSAVIIMTLILLAFMYSTTKNKAVEISFTGDVLLSRGVDKKLKEEGYDYPYRNVKKLLMSDDLTVSNLECPITDEIYSVYKNRKIVFKADKLNSIALKESGINLFNLANNHSMDYGSDGLLDTIEVLEENDLEYFGAGKNYKEARELKIVDVKNVKFGFLSYTVFPPEGYIYSVNQPDVAFYDEKYSLKKIQEAKNFCNFLIVSIHWGNEFEKYPSDTQKDIAHKLIESGGDVVIGHHPHVLQSIEKYNGKYIFYSLGNFIFDKQIAKSSDLSMIVHLDFNNLDNYNWHITPVVISECQVSVANDELAKSIVEMINNISEDKDIIISNNGTWSIK